MILRQKINLCHTQQRHCAKQTGNLNDYVVNIFSSEFQNSLIKFEQ